eukprot:427665-Amphidinium_carterae.1
MPTKCRLVPSLGRFAPTLSSSCLPVGVVVPFPDLAIHVAVVTKPTTSKTQGGPPKPPVLVVAVVNVMWEVDKDKVLSDFEWTHNGKKHFLQQSY